MHIEYVPLHVQRHVTPWQLFLALVFLTIVQNTIGQLYRSFVTREFKAVEPSCAFCSAIKHGKLWRSYHAPRFLRTFWPDHAEFMRVPGDASRTGTACAARIAPLEDTAVITVVTKMWRDEHFERLHMMARSLRRQSVAVVAWWVLILQDEDRTALPRTFKALDRHGANIVTGTGGDLVRAIRRKYHSMPKHVFVDEDFSGALEHTAIEKFQIALESRRADAVSAWSVVYDASDKSQRYFVRSPRSRRGPHMIQAKDASFWAALEKIIPSVRRHVIERLLCNPNLRTVILPEYLIWEDGSAVQHPHDAGLDSEDICLPWARTVDVPKRKISRSQTLKRPDECGHAASVALVIPWLEYGGADQFNVNLVRNLAKPHNIHVVVLTTTGGSLQPIFGEVAAVTEDVFHLNHLLANSEELRSGTTITFVDLVAYLVRSRRAELLFISNSQPAYMNLPALRSRLPGVKIVDYVHSIALDWNDGGYARYSLENRRWVDHTLVSSHMLRDWLRDEGHPLVHEPEGSPSVHVVYVDVDTRECKSLPRGRRRAILNKYGVDPRHTVVVYPARMSPEKNPGLFFEVATRVARTELEITFLAIGDGPLLSELRSNITRKKLGRRIITLGAMTHESTLEAIASSDMLMLTSDYEGIPLSIFEGMAAGVVPFSTDVGAQRELVTPDTGRLIPLDEHVVATYASELISLASEPLKLEKMKKAARKRVVAKFDTRALPYMIWDAIC
jgi:glycosyltransferase involved in cell wall biosynthesis